MGYGLGRACAGMATQFKYPWTHRPRISVDAEIASVSQIEALREHWDVAARARAFWEAREIRRVSGNGRGLTTASSLRSALFTQRGDCVS